MYGPLYLSFSDSDTEHAGVAAAPEGDAKRVRQGHFRRAGRADRCCDGNRTARLQKPRQGASLRSEDVRPIDVDRRHELAVRLERQSVLGREAEDMFAHE